MDPIILDAVDGSHVFVKDRAKSKCPAIKRSVGFTENLGGFFQGIILTEKFYQFGILAVFGMMNLDKANQAV